MSTSEQGAVAPDICTCGCHTSPGILHVIQCCHRCHTCGQRIQLGYEKQHAHYCETVARLERENTRVTEELGWAEERCEKEHANWQELLEASGQRIAAMERERDAALAVTWHCGHGLPADDGKRAIVLASLFAGWARAIDKGQVCNATERARVSRLILTAATTDKAD